MDARSHTAPQEENPGARRASRRRRPCNRHISMLRSLPRRRRRQSTASRQPAIPSPKWNAAAEQHESTAGDESGKTSRTSAASPRGYAARTSPSWRPWTWRTRSRASRSPGLHPDGRQRRERRRSAEPRRRSRGRNRAASGSSGPAARPRCSRGSAGRCRRVRRRASSFWRSGCPARARVPGSSDTMLTPLSSDMVRSLAV